MNALSFLTRFAACFLAVALFAPLAFATGILRVEGAPVISTKAEPMAVWRSAPSTGHTTVITFAPLPTAALKALQEENEPDSSGRLQAKALKIGVTRNADTEIDDATLFALNWQNIGGGHTARLAVTSPNALGIRVALQLRALPDSAELRFSGSGAPERIIGVISGQEANALRDDNKIYWTPVTEGETQNIEIFLPSSIKTEDVKVRLKAASHLFTSAQNGFNTDLVTKAVSLPCNIDVSCKHNALGTAFQNTAKAVARMVYSDFIFTYTCTGTLLKSADNSQTPYFWSAAHCMDSAIGASPQSLANTLNTYWFEEAASCNSIQPNPGYQLLAGGAQILHNKTATDTLLLRLNNPPPAGAFFSGWDATFFSSGAMIGVHHPRGDYKKVSIGKGEGKTCDTIFSDPIVNMASFTLVGVSEGIFESGSSGSGLFTLSNDAYYLRGGLLGGSPYMSCSSPGLPVSYASGNASCYSSLSLVYDEIKQYLGNPGTDPTPPVFGPTREYTGPWYNPSEDNWGLTVLMNFTNSRYIFVPWYTYDSSGKASWYIFQGDVWSANDTFSADVYRYSGSPWGVMPYNNSRVSFNKVGTAKLTFTSATKAQFEYNVEGSSRTVTLTKIE
ncbi:MAG: hypothetical protein LBE75_04760 [Burkholderiales bacterium]|nr:hypothetical protein [Burkholderiales bacterium]